MESGTVRSAARVVETKKSEPMVLGSVGMVLLGLAAYFGWQELQMPAEVLAIFGAVVAAAIAWFASKSKITMLGPLVLGTASVVIGCWYAATKEPVLLIAMGVGFVVSLVLALRGLRHERLDTASDKMHRMMAWLGLAVAGLITTFAGYFQIFDASESVGLQDFVARRAILSLFWLLSGTGLVLVGRSAKANEIRDAGFLVLAASVAKLMFYDTTHTDGAIRIAALAIGGLVLVIASFVSRRVNNAEPVQS